VQAMGEAGGKERGYFLHALATPLQTEPTVQEHVLRRRTVTRDMANTLTGHATQPDTLITIDGSTGEGGGQILRAALTLSVLTGRPFRLINIRARRPKPGLRPQHVTAVHAAAELCHAEVEGNRAGSSTLTFIPRQPVKAGSYRFDVGTAGSTSLILQTILPPLAELDETSWVVLTGGTHVPWSPPYHFLERAFAPAVNRLGWHARMSLKRWGWYPRGGGRVKATIQPATPAPECVDWRHRGALTDLWLLSAASNLPAHVRERQARRARQRLREAGLSPTEVAVVDAPSPGVGTCVIVVATYENGWGGGSALGKKGKPAEQVAEEAVDAFLSFHHSNGALDPHLADQMIVPLLWRVPKWAFSTSHITAHLRTVVWLSTQFIPADITILQEEEHQVTIQCSR